MINTSIFGPIRGRIGNLTAYTRMGKQVFRSVNDRPHNPQTPAQMAQRTLMAGVVEAYKILAPFVRESYETKPPSLTAYNRFVSNNLKQIKVNLDKSEANQRACIAAEYNVSEGTLPPIELRVQDNRLVSSLCLPSPFILNESTTLGQLSGCLVKHNKSLRYGDKITLLHLIQKDPATPGEGPVPRATLEMYELVLADSSRVPIYTLIPAELFCTVDGFAGTAATLKFGAVAYVHSRKTKCITCYSTQSLVVTPGGTLKESYESEDKRRQAGNSYRRFRNDKSDHVSAPSAPPRPRPHPGPKT